MKPDIHVFDKKCGECSCGWKNDWALTKHWEVQWAEHKHASETVACRLCSTPTRMLGTRLCDGCWELETRIRANPELARSILADYDSEMEV